jgi:hypothetical protein
MDTQPIAAGAAQITGTVLFYTKPEPLSREMHGKLGFKQLERPFAFAANSNIVPLAVTEFAPAALSYPIIFAGENKQPLAVMGVSTGENLFIAPDGAAEPDAYLPAYIRRYPFVLADDKPQDRMIVCLERGAAMIAEDGGDLPLFENGEPTEYTRNAITFCNDYETERRRTTSFVDMLNELDLFEVKQAMFTPRLPDGTTGEPQLVAEYFAVSEEKLNKLPTEQFIRLRDNGALGQIYAHLVSTLGWEKLYAKALIRRQEQAAAMPVANDTVN